MSNYQKIRVNFKEYYLILSLIKDNFFWDYKIAKKTVLLYLPTNFLKSIGYL